jgi:predicted ester cyclase
LIRGECCGREEGVRSPARNAAIRRYTRRTLGPMSRASVEDKIAEGDRVVSRWTFSGTRAGGLLGISPTGRGIEMTGINI